MQTAVTPRAGERIDPPARCVDGGGDPVYDSPMFHPDEFDIIDLSVSLQHKAVSEPLKPKIKYTDHRKGYWHLRFLFGVAKRELKRSKGLGWALEKITAITHTGTHVDAPYHYGPESGANPPAASMRPRWSGASPRGCVSISATSEMAMRSASRNWRRHWRRSAIGCGVGRSSCSRPGQMRGSIRNRISSNLGWGAAGVIWLAEHGIKMIGIDAYTIDRPFHSMKKDYREQRDAELLWPAHFAGIEHEYCQIEKLAHLEQIPVDHGFIVSCMPVKIEAASAGWCRAVALVPKGREE